MKILAYNRKQVGGRITSMACMVGWFFALSVVSAGGHGPFDNSARFILHEDSLELEVVMGNEAAARFLKEQPFEALQVRGPSAFYPLPKEVAVRLGTLSGAGEALSAQSVTVHSDGLEVAFSAIYPRPTAGPLGFVPLYINGINEMRPGMLAFTDENGNGLGAAHLNHGTTVAELPFPISMAQPQGLKAEWHQPLKSRLDRISVADLTAASIPLPSRNTSGLGLKAATITVFVAIVGLWLITRFVPKANRRKGAKVTTPPWYSIVLMPLVTPVSA